MAQGRAPELLLRHPDFVIKECSVEDCTKPINGNGFCHKHWKRWKRYGDPMIKLVADRGKGAWKLEPKSGYVRAYRPDHPNAAKDGQISQHTFVMTEHLGRPLRPEETVHHKNGKRDDNRIKNLELWASTHPAGQRVSDLLGWAHELIDLYEEAA